MTTFDFILLAIPAVFALGAFYSAGELIRYRMRAPKVPRFLDDLRGLEDAFVDFFASSGTSAEVLRVLATHAKPIRFKAIAEYLRAPEPDPDHRGETPLTAVRAVLKILLFARLARMGPRGFSITELGREVYRRMRRSDQDNTVRRAVPSGSDRVNPIRLDRASSTRHLRRAGTRSAAIA